MSKRKEVGRNQLDSERDSLDERVEHLKNLGSTKGKKWKRNRRFKAI